MEILKKQRTQLRRLFTRSHNALKLKLDDRESSVQDLTINFKVLEDKTDRLFALEEKIREYSFTDAEVDESETLEKEFDEIEEYREKWLIVKNEYEDRLHEENKGESNSTISENSNFYKKNLRLPKLELKSFDGNLKNWIAFWGQFKRIHEDNSIEAEDKFQYLCQATVLGSPAGDLVASFPPSAANYPKVIEQLKSRFARDELLIEIYVRELLQLVLQKNNIDVERGLRSLYDKLETQLRALESLGVTANKYAAMLYPLVESALPEEVLKAWERLRTSQDCNKLNQTDYLESLLKFLRQEVEREERLFIARSSFTGCRRLSDIKSGNSPTAATIYAADFKKNETLCVWCDKGSHSSQDCYKAKNFNFNENREILKKKGTCFRCFKKGHMSKSCKTSIKCLICHGGHHVIMCTKLSQFPNQGYNDDKKENRREGELNKTETLISHQKNETLLQTLIVKIASNGAQKLVRVLLDSGSQRSYITKDCVHKLGLQQVNEETLTHHLFGGAKTKQQVHGIYKVTIISTDGTYQCTVPMLDQEKICRFVPRLETQSYYPLLKSRNIILSDIGYDVPEVKMLLGADVLGKILTGTILDLDDGVTALETKLGWTVMGQRKTTANFNVVNTICLLNSLDIQNLWRLDTIGITDPAEVKTKEDMEFEILNFFEDTIKINDDGRYEVRLPFKDGHPMLMTNKELAEKRLRITTKKLKAMNKYEEYDHVLREWLELGIIEHVPEGNKNEGHYLPHRAVIKESSLTTKLRPVFDASAKDERGNSLNSCLETGPNLIEKIPQMLMIFRKHTIGVISDVKKAFLQISLDEKDRDFLRFLWWEKDNLITLRHRRVVFGVTSSPFLLGATISHHLNSCMESMSETAKMLKKSFYVDNCITSLKNKEDLDKFVKEANEVMSAGQFELCGWVSSPIKCNNERYTDKDDVNVLGLLWNTSSDELFCNINLITMITSPVTKRNLLSVAQQIFDPIGFTCPSTLLPKLLLQETWINKYGWDEELPHHIANQFKAWLKQVPWLSDCRVPRRLTPNMSKTAEISLHIFCDASKKAYAACVFLRASTDQETSVQLVQAKVRVAPIKPITMPRLELLAAVIGTRLYLQVKNTLELEGCKTYFWSDSSVVLTWIKRKDDWNTFVGNRCKEICQHSDPDDWHHIQGTLNPADLPSRGCSPKTLSKSKWWEGPLWLKGPCSEWPHNDFVAAEEEEVNFEKKKSVIAATNASKGINEDFVFRLLYFSKYTKIIRMVGWIFRFLNNISCDNIKRKGELTCDEFQKAEYFILKLIQLESFTEADIKRKIHAFKDDNGLLRVKTKVLESDENEEFRTPILLPSNHIIVSRLILGEHHRSMHAGLLTLLTRLREKYWILGARRAARQIIYKCVTCKRQKINPLEVPFAPLPKDRVNHAQVFEITGVDYAGPLYLRTKEKSWIVLFTCAVYRAVHLELVVSLTTSAFIQALRRFIARRGRISTLYSDNGTNFVGTNNALQSLDWDEIVSFSTTQQIVWKFIPPTAAWWGGWWERMVRMVKELLRRVLGKSSVDYEELCTILCDCEAVINSRPLTFITNESDELMPLTPVTFIHGISNSETPDLDCVDRSDLIGRAKYLQTLRDNLRQRFRNEYLALLVHRGHRKNDSLQIGDVVLIGNDATKRINWPLGIVLEIYPGRDGISRVAKLKTSQGERIRPFQRLYPLEVCSADTELFKNLDTEREVKVSADIKVTNFPDEENTVITRVGRKIKIPDRLDL